MEVLNALNTHPGAPGQPHAEGIMRQLFDQDMPDTGPISSLHLLHEALLAVTGKSNPEVAVFR